MHFSLTLHALGRAGNRKFERNGLGSHSEFFHFRKVGTSFLNLSTDSFVSTVSARFNIIEAKESK